MSADLKFEFKVDLKPVHYKSYRCRMAKISNEPKLRQCLVLAYQIQDVLEKDATLTSKQIAEWLNMTPPRICQIMDLLLLCPKIQQEILLSENKPLGAAASSGLARGSPEQATSEARSASKDKKLYSMGQYNTREIVKEPLWEKQIEMWDALLKS